MCHIRKRSTSTRGPRTKLRDDESDGSPGVTSEECERAVEDEQEDASYTRQVGLRLRGVRRSKRLSLHDVEIASQKEFKASVLGAYERGERAISVPRLQRLASFYTVPVEQLLPPMSAADSGGPRCRERR